MIENFKKIAPRVVALLLILYVSNVVYVKWFYSADLYEHSPIHGQLVDLNDKAEIIYLGESSNLTVANLDHDKRKISQLLNDYYPEIFIDDITKSAAHAGVYKVMLRNIPQDSPIKTVVVTMNLRSFNSGWINSSLETSLQKELMLLKTECPLLNRGLLSFKEYDIKTEKERLKIVEEQLEAWPLPSLKYESSKQWEESIENTENDMLAKAFVRAYAFELTSENPRVKDFDEIVQIASERGWNLVFNLLAENTDEALNLVGDDLVDLMRKNRDFLKDRYSNSSVVIVDNLELIKDDYFIDQDWTTEHYNLAGRRLIARNLALGLREFHKESFAEYQPKVYRGPIFFNDCEDEMNAWGEMHTISNERSFSGDYSSKVYSEQPYSLAFDYPMAEIADSLKNKLFVSVQVNNQVPVKLILELIGEKVEKQWLAKNIAPSDKWQKVEWVQTFNEAARNSDLIKVYVLNKNKTPIYIDDLKVEFR